MITSTAIVSALWMVWLVGWLLASGWTARTVAHQSPASHLAHSVFVWLGAALLFFHLTIGAPFQVNLLPDSAWIGWVGVVLVFLGLGFAGWARYFLGRLWSGAVTLKADHVIVRSGPYAITRHPIYTGLLLALIGTALERGTIASLLGVVSIVIGIVLKIRQEESLLIGHFGEGYRAYQSEVPALVPRLGRRAA
jgi:protein-S-isoprenylcysteine O-methyltransferase Ste14